VQVPSAHPVMTPVAHVHRGFIQRPIKFGRSKGSGACHSEVAMNKLLLIVLTTAVVLVTGGSLAMMNTACKSSHHSWCAPISDLRQHAKTRHG
jgi:hypothetical protein